MAIVDRTRELEPAQRAADRLGRPARRSRCSTESERLFAETGRYCGVEELELKESDPIRFEKIFSRLRGGLVTPRETALNISASPIVKEIGELCFALYTPEGDSVALSTGIIVHVHTMSDAIKYMIRQGYEENPGIEPGDIFTNNDAMIGDVHNADVQTIVPIFWEGELIGWAAGVTHEIDIGAKTPGSVPIGPISRFEDGIDLPGEEDRRRDDELWRDHVLARPEGHAHADVLDARREDPARRLPHDPRGGRARDPRGGHRHLQALHARGDRGRPALVHQPPARADRAGPLPGAGLHRPAVRQGGAAARHTPARTR